MAKTIYTLIHPFADQSREAENMAIYKDVIGKALADPEAFLFYAASVEDVDTFRNRYPQLTYDHFHDKALQRYFRTLPPELQNRVAVISDKTGEEYTRRGLINPDFILPDALEGRVDPEESSLSWFARHESTSLSYYDPELTSVYTDVTGVTGLPAEEMVSSVDDFHFARFHTEGDRKYIRLPLHTEVAKAVRFLGTQDAGREINGKPVLTVPKEVRDSTNIFGTGEYLDACVFRISMGLSVALGIPVRNVSLNEGQPHIRAEGKDTLPIWRTPVESLYPTPRSVELMRPASRK